MEKFLRKQATAAAALRWSEKKIENLFVVRRGRVKSAVNNIYCRSLSHT